MEKDWKSELFLRLDGRTNHISDLATSHYACIHIPVSVDVLLRSIRSKGPNSGDEFLIRGQPVDIYTFGKIEYNFTCQLYSLSLVSFFKVVELRVYSSLLAT